MKSARKSSSSRVGRVYRFSLFVSGATPKSARAITNIKSICEKHLGGKYKIEVIDVYQQPERLSSDQVVAVPTLVKQSPLPVRKFIGDLSDTHRVVNGLGVEKR
ncbi:MAG TPA: circadian clock KaiB family protein [Candidatus Binatia bacterium]|nr:circadian clock KaiB family protein [Candidatus Binatia bacterium]